MQCDAKRGFPVVETGQGAIDPDKLFDEKPGDDNVGELFPAWTHQRSGSTHWARMLFRHGGSRKNGLSGRGIRYKSWKTEFPEDGRIPNKGNGAVLISK